MLSRKLKAFVDLARPVNVVITLLSIPAASVLAGARVGQWFQVLIAAMTGGLVAAGANAINDYFDTEIDRINKPLRPIPRGDVTKAEARGAWLVLSVLALVLNLLLNRWALAIVVCSVVLLYWYSAFFKRTAITGNVIVAIMTGMAFVYGAVAVGGLYRAIVPAIFAFLVNLAREIIKDVEDVEGDRIENALTLPVRYGIKPALLLASATIVILIATTIAAYLLNLYTVLYLYLVLIVDVVLIIVLVGMWKDQTRSTMNRLSNGLKLCMLVGLVALFLGSP